MTRFNIESPIFMKFVTKKSQISSTMASHKVNKLVGSHFWSVWFCSKSPRFIDVDPESGWQNRCARSVCVESSDWRRGAGAAPDWLSGQRGVSAGEAHSGERTGKWTQSRDRTLALDWHCAFDEINYQMWWVELKAFGLVYVRDADVEFELIY